MPVKIKNKRIKITVKTDADTKIPHTKAVMPIAMPRIGRKKCQSKMAAKIKNSTRNTVRFETGLLEFVMNSPVKFL